MKRGEVWVANLNPNRGAEAGKVRPVIVLQEDRLTEAGLPTIVVVPLTSQRWRQVEPLRVEIRARDRLKEDCHAMVEQIRTLDRSRFGTGPLATLTPEEIAAIEKSLLFTVGVSSSRRSPQP